MRAYPSSFGKDDPVQKGVYTRGYRHDLDLPRLRPRLPFHRWRTRVFRQSWPHQQAFALSRMPRRAQATAIFRRLWWRLAGSPRIFQRHLLELWPRGARAVSAARRPPRLLQRVLPADQRRWLFHTIELLTSQHHRTYGRLTDRAGLSVASPVCGTCHLLDGGIEAIEEVGCADHQEQCRESLLVVVPRSF